MTAISRSAKSQTAEPFWSKFLSWAQRSSVLTVIVVLVIGLPTLTYPIGWDQSIYAYIGDAITRGLVPYRDAWGHNAPGGYYLYALAFSLAGNTAITVYLLALAATLAGVFACFHIGRRLAGGWGGAIAGLLFGVTSILGFPFTQFSEPELFMGAASALSVLAAIKGRDILGRDRANPSFLSPALFFVAGALGAVAILFKPTAILFIPVLVAFCLVGTGKQKARAVRLITVCAASFAGVLFAATAYFWWVGFLPDVWQAVVGYNGSYLQSNRGAGSIMLSLQRAVATSIGLGPVLPLAAYGGWRALRAGTREARMAGLWTILAVGAVVVQFRFYPYHWFYALPPLATIAALGLHDLFVDRTRRLRLILVSMLIAIYAGFWLVPPVSRIQHSIPYLLGWASREEYLAGFHDGSSVYVVTEPAADEAMAEFVRNSSSPGDLVFAWNRPALQFLTGRALPTKYVHLYPLEVNSEGGAREVQAEMLRDVTTKRPRYLIIPPGDLGEMRKYHYPIPAATLEKIQQFADANYRVVRSEKGLVVYELRAR